MSKMTKIAAAGALAAASWIEAQAPPPKAPPTSEETRLISSLEGAELYQSYCAVCHGKEARGDGPMAGTIKTPPPDLTRIAARNRGMFPLQRVQQIISGESGVNAHGTREMPLWGPIFSQVAWDQDLGRVRVYNLAKYLEKIQRH
ncbi:MAG: cytochrome c [Bryobacterales bacterium]|nr:cytochrome c [Bryobacterales bacterium]MBV9399432.1 cytochrome c [Bryobacterales bacterium]